MKKFIFLFLTFSSLNILGQIKSGEYDGGTMFIAYNPIKKIITGYYENSTGLDEKTNNPKFSCAFYLEGKYNINKTQITTYSPKYDDDIIKGELQINKDKEINIKLEDEHGGCWNVEHFKEEFVNLDLDTEKKWIEIRYINIPKSFFYSDKNEISKKRAFLIKGDVVFIDTIDGNWVHCIYKGKKITQGWIKLDELNILK